MHRVGEDLVDPPTGHHVATEKERQHIDHSKPPRERELGLSSGSAGRGNTSRSAPPSEAWSGAAIGTGSALRRICNQRAPFLSGPTLAAADVEENAYAAFKRCVRKLTRRLKAYQADLENADDRSKLQKGTHHELHPDQVPDAERLREAIDQQDYTEFRKAVAVYEEPLRNRIGRWPMG